MELAHVGVGGLQHLPPPGLLATSKPLFRAGRAGRLRVEDARPPWSGIILFLPFLVEKARMDKTMRLQAWKIRAVPSNHSHFSENWQMKWPQIRSQEYSKANPMAEGGTQGPEGLGK